MEQDKIHNNEIVNLRTSLVKVTMKLFLLTVVLFLGLLFSDRMGYFNSEQELDYISKTWDSFDRFTKKNNVDIILLGNSHMFANVNPKNLTTALGANAFAIGGPGSAPHDLYFALKEALKSCKPSLVVLETFCIQGSLKHQIQPHKLTSQLNSFAGRKDLRIKLFSTPVLFEVDHYGYAWSKTIRNHGYIFSKPALLQRNFSLSKESLENQHKDNSDLYLGQLKYYTEGMADTTLEVIKNMEPLIDGNDYEYNKNDEIYIDKIMELCAASGIEVMFFTNPMYPQLIKDYQVWKSTLNDMLGKYHKPWLDLQDNFKAQDFPPICFQNSYKHKNQHLTHIGALVSTYKLVGFIRAHYVDILPNRKLQESWHNTFYAQDGYFLSHSPKKDDEKYRSIKLDFPQKGNALKEVLVIPLEGENNEIIVVIKVKKMPKVFNPELNNLLLLTITYEENGEIKTGPLEVGYASLYNIEGTSIYALKMKSIKILSIIGYSFVNAKTRRYLEQRN